jgi:hypothetical protein
MKFFWLTVFSYAVAMSVVACKAKETDNSSGGPAEIAPKCAEKDSSACATNSKCEIVDKKCSGTADYCLTFSSETNCPFASCKWNSKELSCQQIRADVTPPAPPVTEPVITQPPVTQPPEPEVTPPAIINDKCAQESLLMCVVSQVMSQGCKVVIGVPPRCAAK